MQQKYWLGQGTGHIVMLIKIITFILLYVSLSWASPRYYVCPYELMNEVWYPSIERWTSAICIERWGSLKQCGHNNFQPWAEQQIANDGSKSGWDAIIYTDVSNAIHDDLIKESPGGAGCKETTRIELTSDIIKPIKDRVYYKDAILNNGVIVKSDDSSIIEQEIKVPIRGALIPEFIKKIVYFLHIPQITEILSPQALYALGTFPDTNFTEDFSGGSQDPISGNWSGPFVGGLGTCNRTSGGALNCTFQESAYYAAKQAAGDADIAITLTTTGDFHPACGRGVVNTSGYCAVLASTASQLNVYRYDGGTTFVGLGSTCAQATDTDDMIGLRMLGSSIVSYHNDEGTGGWTSICSRTSTTYPSVPGYAWVWDGSGTRGLDNFRITFPGGVPMNVLLRRGNR